MCEGLSYAIQWKLRGAYVNIPIGSRRPGLDDGLWLAGSTPVGPQPLSQIYRELSSGCITNY